MARTEVDACALIDAGFEYVRDFDNARIFRKKAPGYHLDKTLAIFNI
jgi:hypothetical protein